MICHGCLYGVVCPGNIRSSLFFLRVAGRHDIFVRTRLMTEGRIEGHSLGACERNCTKKPNTHVA